MKSNLLFSFLLLLSACSTTNVVHKSETKVENFFAGVSKKKKNAKVQLIDHKYFKIAYDEEHRLAKYVVYQLTREQVSKKIAERQNKFKADPYLKSQNIPFVSPSEYNRSGYDRGHLAPSADFAWNQEANDLTFVMSNMAPQQPNLNRDAWKRLEEQVRKWACGEEKITVITGPVIKDGLTRLKSGLEVPEDFFKVIIDETPPVKIISFLYHQSDKGDVLSKRIIPINTLENSTGIAFNSEFPFIEMANKRKPASIDEWKECE